MTISVEANQNNSHGVDWEANEKAQKESFYSECLKECRALILCPPGAGAVTAYWQTPEGHVQWNRNLQCHREQMYAPGGGSDARAAVDVPTQTPEAGASQMLPDPGMLDL